MMCYNRVNIIMEIERKERSKTGAVKSQPDKGGRVRMKGSAMSRTEMKYKVLKH